MTESTHAPEVLELVKSIYKLYERFGVPDELPFLDWSLSLSWRTPAPGLDRHEEISVDPEFLHHIGWSPWGGCEVHVHLSRDEFTVKGSWSKVRPRVDDLASPSERFGGRD